MKRISEGFMSVKDQKNNVQRKKRLINLIESFEEKGKNSFHRDEIRNEFVTERALTAAIDKLIKKQRIVSPCAKIYVIVPTQYRSLGAPPGLWFLHDWMSSINAVDYYVGLLSAAAIYGATHHAVQETEVIVQKQLPSKVIGSSRFRFFYSKQTHLTPKQKWSVPTGYVWVSSPSATVLELISYMPKIGGPSLIATVLSELCDCIKIGEISSAAEKMKIKFPLLQRLGVILDILDLKEFAKEVFEIISTRKIRPVSLNVERNLSKKDFFNHKWKVYMNDKVEPDL